MSSSECTNLPCGECGASEGEACDFWCTWADPGAVTVADLVATGNHAYAVRHCQRCQGDGRDLTDAERPQCRCVRDLIDYFDLRVSDLHERLRDLSEDADSERERLADQQRRWSALALAFALRELDLTAFVGAQGTVTLWTTSGSVHIAVPAVGFVAIDFNDGTHLTWTVPPVQDDPRAVAWAIQKCTTN